MKPEEFKIGDEFYTHTGKWRCTDVGTRTIIAIKLDRDYDTSWYIGPPYALAEDVFDEDSLEAVYTEKDLSIEEMKMGLAHFHFHLFVVVHS